MKWLSHAALLLGTVLVLAGCTATPPDCSLGQPIASFNCSPTDGELPVLVTFDASESSGGGRPLVSYVWDFGDGTTAVGPVVRHRFERRPGSTGEQAFTVTLTVTRKLGHGDSPTCVQSAATRRTLRYGISRPLDVVRWEVKEIYYGTMIEGYVQVVGTGIRVTHGQVIARFYRGPNHELVHEASASEVWDVRPGEERLFMITSTIRAWQFDWVELRTVAQTGPL